MSSAPYSLVLPCMFTLISLSVRLPIASLMNRDTHHCSQDAVFDCLAFDSRADGWESLRVTSPESFASVILDQLCTTGKIPSEPFRPLLYISASPPELSLTCAGTRLCSVPAVSRTSKMTAGFRTRHRGAASPCTMVTARRRRTLLRQQLQLVIKESIRHGPALRMRLVHEVRAR